MRRAQDDFVDDSGTITRNFDGRIHIARCQVEWHGGSTETFSVHHRSTDEAMLLTLPSGIVLKIKSPESVAVLTQWFTALHAIPKELTARPDASAPQEEEDLVNQLKNKRLYEVCEWACCGIAHTRFPKCAAHRAPAGPGKAVAHL